MLSEFTPPSDLNPGKVWGRGGIGAGAEGCEAAGREAAKAAGDAGADFMAFSTLFARSRSEAKRSAYSFSVFAMADARSSRCAWSTAACWARSS